MLNLKTITVESAIAHNEKLEKDRNPWSEERPYNIEKVAEFIEKYQNEYTYIDEPDAGNWECMTLVQYTAKYGVQRAYLDHERKLWRYNQTIGEFYGGAIVD